MRLAKTILMAVLMCIASVGQLACEARMSPAASQPAAGSYDNYIAACTKAIQSRPNDAELYFRRGFIYSLAGRPDRAIVDYTRAIELNPGHAIAYENRGTAYFRLWQNERALADYTKAIEIKSDYAVAYANRALCHYALREYDKAWADIAMCRKRGGSPDPGLISVLQRDSGRNQ